MTEVRIPARDPGSVMGRMPVTGAATHVPAHLLVVLALSIIGMAGANVDALDATREGPPPTGASECPCLNGTESEYAAARAAFVSLGYPAGYGMQGCKSYDVGLTFDGCNAADPPPFCDKPWCYVDSEKCGVNADKCKMAGGQVGGEVSPYCRGRDHVSSGALPATFENSSPAGASRPSYSYTTCGVVDLYGPLQMAKTVGTHHLRVSIPSDPYPPWVVAGEVDKARPHWAGYKGAQCTSENRVAMPKL